MKIQLPDSLRHRAASIVAFDDRGRILWERKIPRKQRQAVAWNQWARGQALAQKRRPVQQTRWEKWADSKCVSCCSSRKTFERRRIEKRERGEVKSKGWLQASSRMASALRQRNTRRAATVWGRWADTVQSNMRKRKLQNDSNNEKFRLGTD